MELTVSWNSGTIFGIAVMVIFEPIALFTTYKFYKRRHLQPIKSRSPLLVMLTDVILMLYVFLACLQRIIVNNYPCYVNLWSAYIGTIILFNTYLWRCWVLYFRFHLTQQLLLKGEQEWHESDEQDFFMRNRQYITDRFLGKVAMSTLLVLWIPCLILTITDNTTLTNTFGDSCDFHWGRYVLGIICVIYIVCFIFFAYKLRQVVDGFNIKNELKLTGLIGVIAVIPWFLFNQIYYDINSTVFPFSTLSLLIGLFFAFLNSTMYPLIRTYYKPPTVTFAELPQDLDKLESLITTKQGFESFRKFLTAEFSVENLLFYADVEDLRKKITLGASIEILKQENKRLYNKYVISDAPFQVNLPDLIVASISVKMKIFMNEGKVDLEKNADPLAMAEHQPQPPTIFDEAQGCIYKLMETDSFQRYKTSAVYSEYVKTVNQQLHKTSVLKSMEII